MSTQSFDEQTEMFDRRAAEIRKRDAALDLLRETRTHFIAEARRQAEACLREHGEVTSSMVLLRMRKWFPDLCEGVDPRALGPVFQGRDGWYPAGWVETGSHGRPVRVWRKR